jgi:hypothetical protein
MSLASYFFRNPRPDIALLKRYFWYFSFHNDDLLSNTTHLRDHVRKFHAARNGEDFEFGRFVIDRQRLRATSYSTRGRLSRAMLALYASQCPRDWQQTDRSVLTPVYYALTDHPNLHHVFPLDFCEKHLTNEQETEYANSLLNIAYLTQLTNLRISNKNPLEYMRDYIGHDFGPVQRSHFLPDTVFEWATAEATPEGALTTFAERRLDLILDQLRSDLAPLHVNVIDSGAGQETEPSEQKTEPSEQTTAEQAPPP